MVNIVDNTCNGNARLLTIADPVVAGLTHSTITLIALSSHLSFFCHDWGTAVIEPETKCSQSCCGLVLGTTYTSRRF